MVHCHAWSISELSCLTGEVVWNYKLVNGRCWQMYAFVYNNSCCSSSSSFVSCYCFLFYCCIVNFLDWINPETNQSSKSVFSPPQYNRFLRLWVVSESLLWSEDFLETVVGVWFPACLAFRAFFPRIHSASRMRSSDSQCLLVILISPCCTVILSRM